MLIIENVWKLAQEPHLRGRIVFVEDYDDGLPREWIALMRSSMTAFIGRFSTRRTLTDYAETMYGLSQAVPVA